MEDNRPLVFYIATDGDAMGRAEMALVHSIGVHCSVPWGFVFMDETRGEPAWMDWNSDHWFTKFSNFRWAVPEVHGFRGRAVYMDVDQLVLKDPKELFELEIPEDKAWLAIDPTRTDVMVFDCAKFEDLANWPSLAEMKRSMDSVGHYSDRIEHLWHPLPQRWCCNDGGIMSEQGNKFQTEEYDPEVTCLLHYTQMDWQPWKPYPGKFKYPPHPHARAESIWWQMYAGALEAKIAAMDETS